MLEEVVGSVVVVAVVGRKLEAAAAKEALVKG